MNKIAHGIVGERLVLNDYLMIYRIFYLKGAWGVFI